MDVPAGAAEACAYTDGPNAELVNPCTAIACPQISGCRAWPEALRVHSAGAVHEGHPMCLGPRAPRWDEGFAACAYGCSRHADLSYMVLACCGADADVSSPELQVLMLQELIDRVGPHSGSNSCHEGGCRMLTACNPSRKQQLPYTDDAASRSATCPIRHGCRAPSWENSGPRAARALWCAAWGLNRCTPSSNTHMLCGPAGLPGACMQQVAS